MIVGNSDFGNIYGCLRLRLPELNKFVIFSKPCSLTFLHIAPKYCYITTSM